MHNDHVHSKLYAVQPSLTLYYCSYKDATLSKKQYIESVAAINLYWANSILHSSLLDAVTPTTEQACVQSKEFISRSTVRHCRRR